MCDFTGLVSSSYTGIVASAGQGANWKTHSVGGEHIGGGVGGTIHFEFKATTVQKN